MVTKIIVPWHNREQLNRFLTAWNVFETDDRLVLVQDKDKSGCAATKNRGIKLAMEEGADTVIVLDDDCFPVENQTLGYFIVWHLEALKPKAIQAFKPVTTPESSRPDSGFLRLMVSPILPSCKAWSCAEMLIFPGSPMCIVTSWPFFTITEGRMSFLDKI
jgi:hypothetical protein